MELKKSNLQSGDKVVLQSYFEDDEPHFSYVLLELGTMHSVWSDMFFTNSLSDYDENLNYHERRWNNHMDALEVYRNDVLIMKR